MPDPPILVVEDDADVRELIAEPLRAAGYRVTGAVTGEDAVASARTERPALVVLDLLLPGISGWEALRRIRADAAGGQVRALVVSIIDRDGPGDPVDGYIVKPFRPSQIVHQVAELVGPPKREVMT